MTNPTKEHREEAREKLLPCPFCGCAAVLGMFNAWCGICQSATAPDIDAETNEIIQHWNTRTELKARDTEIRNVLEDLAWTREVGGKVIIHWCSETGGCSDACDNARALYNKVSGNEECAERGTDRERTNRHL